MPRRHDLTGHTFGFWTALEYQPRQGHSVWRCRCQCGVERTVPTTNLLRGLSKSCGCQQRKERRHCLQCGKSFMPHHRQRYCSLDCHRQSRRLDLTGKQFGRLAVLAAAKTQGKKTTWLCRCGCGQEVVVLTSNLTRGNTTSCGCKRGEVFPAASHQPLLAKVCPVCQCDYRGTYKQKFCSTDCLQRSLYPARIIHCPICDEDKEYAGRGAGHRVYCKECKAIAKRLVDRAYQNISLEEEAFLLRLKLAEKGTSHDNDGNRPQS